MWWMMMTVDLIVEAPPTSFHSVAATSDRDRSTLAARLLPDLEHCLRDLAFELEGILSEAVRTWSDDASQDALSMLNDDHRRHSRWLFVSETFDRVTVVVANVALIIV
jgi:hypothetical protein